MSPISKIVFASGNPGKIREVAEILSDLNITVVPQKEFDIESPEETGSTFVENALLKARHASAQSGLPAIADDSGIVVDALDGRPGVWSARYAGEYATNEDNVNKLLEEMSDVLRTERGGEFHCAAVLVCPDVEVDPLVAESTWRGEILLEPRGDGGFGYDPVFFDRRFMKTGAEMSPEEKNSVSHRGRAFRELKKLLMQRLPPNQR